MQTPPLPSPLRSGNLEIKDAQWAKKNDGRNISYHIISHLGAIGAQALPQKFNFLKKWPNLKGKLELIWRLFFA